MNSRHRSQALQLQRAGRKIRLLPLFLYGAMHSVEAAEGATETVAISSKAGSPGDIFSSGYIFEMLGALVLVFLCFFVVVVVIKRINGKQFGGRNHIQLVSSMGIGPREKLVLLQVGQTQLLLGSTPNNIRTLHTFAEPVVSLDEPETRSSGFYSVLASLGVTSRPGSTPLSPDEARLS